MNKERIFEYFDKCEEVYIPNLAEELGIDLEEAREIIRLYILHLFIEGVKD